MLAELQRADVRDDVPAVARRHLRAVIGHSSEPVRHHVEEITRFHLPEPIAVERLRLRIPSLHDHAAAAAGAVVAGRAVDVETFLSAIQHFLRHRERQLVDEEGAVLAGEERRVGLKRAARNRALDERSGARRVREERALPKRPVLRLVVHVLPAGCR
jgi:hypothetical protein